MGVCRKAKSASHPTGNLTMSMFTCACKHTNITVRKTVRTGNAVLCKTFVSKFILKTTTPGGCGVIVVKVCVGSCDRLLPVLLVSLFIDEYLFVALSPTPAPLGLHPLPSRRKMRRSCLRCLMLSHTQCCPPAPPPQT